MIDTLTGKDYPHLCTECRAAIDSVVDLVREGPDTDDDEAACMFVYDHRMYCGGHECVGGFQRIKDEIRAILGRGPADGWELMQETGVTTPYVVKQALLMLSREGAALPAVTW